MLAVLLTVGLFLIWSLFGLAALVALGADVRNLRIALTAPALGTALTVVPLFALSNAGVPLKPAALPVAAALVAGSLIALVWRRRFPSPTVVPVFLVCLVSVVVLGRPMFEFGFDWIANANGDMAYYVLAATNLMEHGLQSPVDTAALARNREFATYAQHLHLLGLRPGTQIMLGGLAATTGMAPLALYMPMALAINMCCICATGALAMQASRRWWAAAVAAALLVASPLAGYGVLQQLTPQVWGLALAVALFAWLMRPELYEARVPIVPDLAVITILVAALFVVYYDGASSLVVAYALYVVILVVQRRFSLRAAAVLWAVPLLAIAALANTFLPRALGVLRAAAQFGVSTGFETTVQLFGYALVPTALPGVAGLRRLFAPPTAEYMNLSIVAAALVAVVVLAAVVNTARRGAAAAIAVLGSVAVGVVLARNENDFALFKLYMYVQPFLAAAVAVALSSLTRRAMVGAACALVAVVGAQLVTLNSYVEDSRDPIDLPDASEADVLPAFRDFLATTRAPLIPVTDNFVLATLFGAQADDEPLFFLSRDVFGLSWKEQTFPLGRSNGEDLRFGQNRDAARLLRTERCAIVLPTGSQLAANRRRFADGLPDLVLRRCRDAQNLLVYVVSREGQAATLPQNRRAVSFWQLEEDPAFPGRTFSGFGRYALFQLLNPSPRVRLSLDFSTSSVVTSEDSYRLPAAAAVGARRSRFPVVGGGSARVFSSPLRPRMIGGQPYIVLDMGRKAEFPRIPRPGLTGMWGTSVSLDPRGLTSYVRDVSLVTDAEYAALPAPAAVTSFPADLGDRGLEYSGIYEDGWVGRVAYAVLAGGGRATLRLRADVLSQPRGQHLRLRVNGKTLFSRAVRPGVLNVDVPVAASEGRRRVELRWRGEARLSAADRRSASARLLYVGVEPSN